MPYPAEPAKDGKVTIITNGRLRELLTWEDLPKRYRVEFDYIEGEDRLSPRFVKYRDSWYDVNDVDARTPFPHDRRWLFQSESFWSGVLFRFPEDELERGDLEHVIVGYYHFS